LVEDAVKAYAIFSGAAVVAAAVLACGRDGTEMISPPPPDSVITFSGAVQPIFTRNCAFETGCHAGPDAQKGMDLSAGKAYANTVNVPSVEVPRLFRVAPGNADSSYLALKIQGRAGLVGGVGTRMPLGGALSQAQVDTVMAWINAGAKNNE
jgi:hypothetical protein